MKRIILAAIVFLLAVTLSAQTFPNGVASGDVTSDSAVLWARSSLAGDVRFIVFERNSWPPLVRSQRATVSDTAVSAKVEVTGLRAGRRYTYVVFAPNGQSMRGEFVTPASPDNRRGLHFGVSGDWRGELAPYPSITNAATARLDFFVEFGDTIYADVPSPAVPAAQATTLAEYRAKHSEVYSSHNNLNSLADLRDQRLQRHRVGTVYFVRHRAASRWGNSGSKHARGGIHLHSQPSTRRPRSQLKASRRQLDRIPLSASFPAEVEFARVPTETLTRLLGDGESHCSVVDETLLVVPDRARAVDTARAWIARVDHLHPAITCSPVFDPSEILKVRLHLGGGFEKLVKLSADPVGEGASEMQPR